MIAVPEEGELIIQDGYLLMELGGLTVAQRHPNALLLEMVGPRRAEVVADLSEHQGFTGLVGSHARLEIAPDGVRWAWVLED